MYNNGVICDQLSEGLRTNILLGSTAIGSLSLIACIGAVILLI